MVIRKIFHLNCLFFICFTAPQVGFTQLEEVADTMETLYSLFQDGTPKEQTAAAHQLAQLTLYDSLERSKFYASMGVDMAAKNDDAVGQAQNYQILGLAHELEGYLDEAREFYRAGLSKVATTNLELAAELTMQIGVAYHIEGNRGRALEELVAALTIAREGGMHQLQSEVFNQIGTIYLEQQNYDEAIEIYENTLSILDPEDVKCIALAHQNLGTAYALSDRPVQSINSLEKASEYYEALHLQDDVAEVKWRLAQTYYSLGNMDKSRQLNVEMLNHLSEYYPTVRSRVLLLASYFDMDKKEWENAQSRLDQGFSLIEDSNRELEKSEYLDAYTRLFSSIGDYKQAFHFAVRNRSVQATLNQISRMSLEKEMSVRFRVQEKEADLVVQMEQNLRTKREKNWLLGLFVLTFLLLGASIRYASFKSKANRELSRKKQLIEKNLKEKEVLLQEIHHRVKNNLQVVSSLLNLQARSLKGKEGAQAIEEGKNRVRSMALIHQNLYQAENLEGVQTGKYIAKLCRSLFNSYSAKGQNIEIETEIEDMTLDIDTIIPIGLILNELISNALKYAFEGQHDKGLIKVALTRSGERLDLTVKDNGKGISICDLDFRNSMGFRLIDAFVKKLSGTFAISNEEGAHISMKFNSKNLTSLAS